MVLSIYRQAFLQFCYRFVCNLTQKTIHRAITHNQSIIISVMNFISNFRANQQGSIYKSFLEKSRQAEMFAFTVEREPPRGTTRSA